MIESVKKRFLNINFIVSLGIWLALILIHSFSIGGEANGTIPFFWSKPSLYYSTWFLDLLLIGTWYLNYYLLAPKLIRHRKFVAYAVIVLLFMLLGLFFQLMLYYLLQWEMPIPNGMAKVSLYGFMTMLALFALGLSARSVVSWIDLQQQKETLEKTLTEKEATITLLQQQLEAKETSPQPIIEEKEVDNLDKLSKDEIQNMADEILEEDRNEPLL